MSFDILGMFLARRCSEVALVVPDTVRRVLIGVFVWPSSDEPVGFLVEHRVNGLPWYSWLTRAARTSRRPR